MVHRTIPSDTMPCATSDRVRRILCITSTVPRRIILFAWQHNNPGHVSCVPELPQSSDGLALRWRNQGSVCSGVLVSTVYADLVTANTLFMPLISKPSLKFSEASLYITRIMSDRAYTAMQCFLADNDSSHQISPKAQTLSRYSNSL